MAHYVTAERFTFCYPKAAGNIALNSLSTHQASIIRYDCRPVKRRLLHTHPTRYHTQHSLLSAPFFLGVKTKPSLCERGVICALTVSVASADLVLFRGIPATRPKLFNCASTHLSCTEKAALSQPTPLHSVGFAQHRP